MIWLKRHLWILLLCGVFSAINYFSADIICALSYPGYKYVDQAVSELSAIGAPTEMLWKKLNILYSPFIIVFGIGVFLAAEKRALKITGVLLVLFGVSGYVWWFFPMNMRGNIGSASDTGHLILSAFTVLILTLILAFGSGAQGKTFRIYSILTILLMLFFGGLVAMMAPKVEAQEPTPWMGIYERISVFSTFVWMSVLALILIKSEKNKLRLDTSKMVGRRQRS